MQSLEVPKTTLRFDRGYNDLQNLLIAVAVAVYYRERTAMKISSRMKHTGQSPEEEPNTEFPPVLSSGSLDTIICLAVIPDHMKGVLPTREVYLSLPFRVVTGAPSLDCLHG